ncbi:hypothetical protein HDU86_005645 [Geranomyces michiganensis]|nr:hypothetical protein HDU86_005645 [Geranomyces michiganensis]
MSLCSLPDEFLAFLTATGVDPAEYVYASPLPRYIRINPRHAAPPTVAALAAALNAPLYAVPWLPSFYRLNPDVRIGNTAPYKAAEIYGTDVASGVAVNALGVKPDDHVLDLCCAPGMKLCLIADIQAGGFGTVTGVDMSLDRMRVCRGVVRKYGLQRARLYVADGTTFDVRPPEVRESRRLQLQNEVVDATAEEREEQEGLFDFDPFGTADEEENGLASADNSKEDEENAADVGETLTALQDQKSASSTKPFHASRLVRYLPSSPSSMYDKVLVDAECTHDGSIAHLLKYDRLGWATFATKFLDPTRIASLHSLQLALLCNGFRLCKPGGTVVYATCSFTTAQNEDIVRDFMAKVPAGGVQLEKIEPVDERHPFPVAKSLSSLYPDVAGIEHCLRFSPVASETSGLFIAKFTKNQL